MSKTASLAEIAQKMNGLGQGRLFPLNGYTRPSIILLLFVLFA